MKGSKQTALEGTALWAQVSRTVVVNKVVEHAAAQVGRQVRAQRGQSHHSRLGVAASHLQRHLAAQNRVQEPPGGNNGPASVGVA